MKNRILKGIVAISLVMTLTMANFILIGINAVSYAADVITQTKETNNKNVKYEVYFKTLDGEKVYEKGEKIDSQDMKLYVKVSVENEGYFNGDIQIANGNIEIKDQKLSKNINKIEGNKISLNQINAGEEIEVELQIKVKTTQTEIEAGLLNMQSEVKLTGTYTNSKAKEEKIDTTKNVKLILEDPYEEGEGLNLKSDIITNKIYNINGEAKRLIQVKIESNLIDNKYPIKETKMEANIPKDAEDIKVIAIKTLATNGKDEIADANWQKDKDNKIIIATVNEEVNQKINWNKEGTDIYVITYLVPEQTKELTTVINGTVKLYDQLETVKQSQISIKADEEKDGTIETVTISEENEIYKGKIYAKQEREFNTTTELNVNYADITSEVTVRENQLMYGTLNDTELTSNIQYKTTTINKKQMQEVLGQEGTIIIEDKDGKEIAKITKDSQENSEGNIVINYPEEIKEITIRTSKPQKEGKIEIKHIKTIKAEISDTEVLKTIQTIKQQIITEHDETEITNEINISLKEPETVSKLEISKNSLTTTTENKAVEMKAILKTNDEKNDLYKNPVIRIQLPNGIESININTINLLYDDELKIDTAKLYNNSDGTKTIEIKLKGEQTKYTENPVAEGPTIIVNANINLNRKTPAGTSTIKMTTENEKVTTYKDGTNEQEKKIEIVAPTEIIVSNTMTTSNISSIGEEETKTKLIEVGSTEKEEEVKIEVVNNKESKVENVQILGNFPTKSTENTINTEITKQIEVEGIDTSKIQVYYSQKENATAEKNAENGWTETIENAKETKSYLIEVASMEQGENLTATYGVKIPGELQYNEEAYEKYEVTYTNTLTGQEETEQATQLGVTTGVGPELKATLKAYTRNEEVTDNTKIYAGEVIKYVVTLENTGTEDATNVKFEENVPENTKIYNDGYEYLYNFGYIDSIPDAMTNKIYKKLAVGEKVVDTYEVEVNKDIKLNTSIINKISVTSDQISTESSQNIITVEPASISARILQDGKIYEDHTLTQGYASHLILSVENSSNEDIKDVKLKLSSKYITIEDIFADETSSNVVIDTDKNIITISTLPKNTTMKFGLDTYASTDISLTENELGYVYTEVEAGGNTYISNIMEYTIKPQVKPTMQITQTSDTSDRYVKEGDKITYKVIVKNTGEIDLTEVFIKDIIPNKLTPLKITVNGSTVQESNTDNEIDNDINISAITNLKKGETVEIDITAIVDTGVQESKTVKLTNTVEAINYEYNISVKSEEVVHYLEAINEDGSNGNNSNNNGNNSDGNNNAQTHSISGLAWIDTDGNGTKDSSETLLSDITVELLDVGTNKMVENSSGTKITTKTDSDGFYSLDNIPNGKYIVVFEYDTSKYTPTTYKADGVAESKNSNVILNTMNINGETKTVATSDTLTINDNNISNINIGLKEVKVFDMKLDKYISKISVNNKQGTKTYEYTDETLAKVELHSKAIVGTNIVVEYEIRVTNNGEAEGYVRSIVDYVPSGLKFNSELNQDWYQLDNDIYNTSLANETILPGETKSVKLVLTKQVTSDAAEIISNQAEIQESYTPTGLDDTNSTPGNRVQGENDMGKADLIITVSTGEIFRNITFITIAIFMLIGVSVYIINKRVIKKK